MAVVKAPETVVVEHIVAISAFAIFVVLWALFAIAIVISQGSLDAIWAWLKDQHIVVQALVWIFFLPVTAGLWVWETGWPLMGRLVVIGGLALATLFVFFPRFLLGPRP